MQGKQVGGIQLDSSKIVLFVCFHIYYHIWCVRKYIVDNCMFLIGWISLGQNVDYKNIVKTISRFKMENLFFKNRIWISDGL